MSWHTTSVLIAEESFLCGRTVQWNKQGEMFARELVMAAIGNAIVNIRKFIDVQYTIHNKESHG